MTMVFDGISAEVECFGDVHGGLFFADEPQDAKFGLGKSNIRLKEGLAGLVVGADAGHDQLDAGEELGFVDGFYEVVGGMGGGGFFDHAPVLIGGDVNDLEGIAAAQVDDEVDARMFFLQVDIAE